MNEHSQKSFFETFESRRPIFEGIKTHYETNVVPDLKELDVKRVETHSLALFGQLFVGLIGLLFTTFLVSAFGLFGLMFGVIPTIIVMVFTWGLQTKTFVHDAKQTLIGGVISYFGWTYSPKSEEPKIFKRLSKLRLFTGFDSKQFSDRIEGVAFDKKFSLTEIFLTRTETRTSTDHNGNTTTETHTVTVFNGCLISIDTPQEFLGETIVLRRGFLFNPKKVKTLKKVGLVSSKFEKVFNAYGTDQVESRYLLPLTLIEQIIAYEKAFKGKDVRFAFIEGQLHIVVETGARFEFKRMAESMLSTSRITTLLKEIEATFDLMEGLLVKAPEDWKETFGHNAFLTKGELKS